MWNALLTCLRPPTPCPLQGRRDDDEEDYGSEGDEEEAEDGNGSEDEEAELAVEEEADAAEADLGTLAAFLTAQWEKKQDDEGLGSVLDKPLKIEWMSDPLRLQWFVLLSHGGYFAGAVYINGKAVIHKTFHRYIVRRKQVLEGRDRGWGCPRAWGL